MFRISDLIDLPILTLMQENSLRINVKSILLDGFNNRIAAIICKEGTLKKSYKIIPYEKIIAIDTNGIIISDLHCIEKLRDKEINEFLQLGAVINKIVKSSNGDLYGILTDIYINLLNGKITAYELSEGYLDDLVNGRRIINISENLNNTLVNKEIILYQMLN
ncbi:MAG: hypothetical protein A2Y23_13670 [Clostridiales bacterium GWB2_37_7]|nr:MAG: hypothetical protein A2Y23_13670 [Clostridiales bacterium GWB2_37_7]